MHLLTLAYRVCSTASSTSSDLGGSRRGRVLSVWSTPFQPSAPADGLDLRPEPAGSITSTSHECSVGGDLQPCLMRHAGLPQTGNGSPMIALPNHFPAIPGML